jgi:hypothetical protein
VCSVSPIWGKLRVEAACYRNLFANLDYFDCVSVAESRNSFFAFMSWATSFVLALASKNVYDWEGSRPFDPTALFEAQP